MTKLISLKVDEKLLEELQMLAKQVGTSRNKYINEAINTYNKIQRKEQIRIALQKASMLVREENMRILEEFEALEDDYETLF